MSVTAPHAGRDVRRQSRFDGLDPAMAHQVAIAARALDLGRQGEAVLALAPALSAHPDHPEVLRLNAGILNLRGDIPAALEAMRRAVELRPYDPLCHNTLGTILGTAGDFDAAIVSLRRACDLAPRLSAGWFNLGVMLTRCVRNEEAVTALRQAVELAPDHAAARALLADILRMSGDTEAAEAEYRRVLAERPGAGMAWWGLADIRTSRFQPSDIEQMRNAIQDSDASVDDRIAIGFALAKALDDEGRYAESLDTLAQANVLARQRTCWDAVAFSASITAITDAFTPPRVGTGRVDMGREVVFIVGMPRSGTTLIEQILASHSRVDGAGELTDVSMVLAEESRRRGKPFPRWVGQTQPGDWQRLGERYLERTARWRRKRPIFTDKLPSNWMYIGAIRAMLPAAHIVVCRRNPVETCFSCYRQHMAGNEYTRTFDDLAAFWRDFDRSVTHWATLHSGHIYQHDYESLVADPEPGIKNLLGFCGLSFEEACLRFYETERDVRSPSATQVRQPIRGDTARASRYGALLDPLRIALATPSVEA